VVYTNAAYSRLSGIDSHHAVGKSITSLLAVPEENNSSGVDNNGNDGPQADTAAGSQNLQPAGGEQPPNPPGGDDQTYLAAEAAGRARAEATQEDKADMCLERLIAASGFGQIQEVSLLSKSHQMVGHDVTVTSNGAKIAGKSADDNSNESSISSSPFESGPTEIMACNMAISPVVSSPEAFTVSTTVTDNDHQESRHHKSKRRKQHHHEEAVQQSGGQHHHHPRSVTLREISLHRKRHLITHFVIQLEPQENDGNFGNLEMHSASSTTAEAHVLGMTKSELRRMRKRPASEMLQVASQQQAENDNNNMDVDDGAEDTNSQSSGTREAVTAIG
jgi:hypothetical protein